ncbi:MAG TPA: hypothetical protein VME42_14690 [Steroidobacteraceae bacterium]|nr:hypothetical protein [Steroidobacteraceae bacterium]
MTAKAPVLDAGFIDQQRRRLEKLRSQLIAAARRDEAEQTAVQDDSIQAPREYEEDAQRLAMLELEGNLAARDLERLNRVDRALRKIEQGTYGLSDRSGAPIPRERLEAAPESIFTLAEEQALEARARPN